MKSLWVLYCRLDKRSNSKRSGECWWAFFSQSLTFYSLNESFNESNNCENNQQIGQCSENNPEVKQPDHYFVEKIKNYKIQSASCSCAVQVFSDHNTRFQTERSPWEVEGGKGQKHSGAAAQLFTAQFLFSYEWQPGQKTLFKLLSWLWQFNNPRPCSRLSPVRWPVAIQYHVKH